MSDYPIMKFAGCWQDMPEKVFNEFLAEIAQRRQQAFSRRRSDETDLDWYLVPGGRAGLAELKDEAISQSESSANEAIVG